MNSTDAATDPAVWAGGIWEGDTSWPARTSRAYDLAVRLEHGMTHHPAHPPYSYTLVKKHGKHNYPGGISSAMELITMPGPRAPAPARSRSFRPLVWPGHLVDGEVLFGRYVHAAISPRTPDRKAALAARHLVGRLAETAGVAVAVAFPTFLASAEASFVIGAQLTVEGGRGPVNRQFSVGRDGRSGERHEGLGDFRVRELLARATRPEAHVVDPAEDVARH